MNAIIVNYDPFAMESRVNIYKDGMQEHIVVHSDVEALANEIINIAYAQNIYEVKTHAPFAFTSEIAKRVHELEQLQYSQKKILVEGI